MNSKASGIDKKREQKEEVVVDLNPIPSVWWRLTALSLSMLISSLGTSIANVGLPTLAQVFNTSFQSVQWVVLSYLLAITTVTIGVGRLGDIINRRRLLLVGIAWFTTASLLCGFSPSIGFLLVGRIAQGLGAAIMITMTMALVGETIGRENTGRAMGLLGTMSAVGTALGPSFGGVLIFHFGWQSIFIITIPLGLLAFILVYRYLPIANGAPKKERARFDTLGMLFLGLTLILYALSMTLGHGHFSSFNVILLLCAVFSAVVFVWVEQRSAIPLIQFAIFKHSGLSSGLMMSILVTTSMMATLVVGPFYLSYALALSTNSVGLVMSAGPFVAAIVGVPAGHLVDRIGSHKIVCSGLIGMAAGAFILSQISVNQGLWGYVAPIVLITAGYAFFQAGNNTALLQNSALETRGMISGMLNLSRNLGLITGASAMGMIFTSTAAITNIRSASIEAISYGMTSVFLVVGFLGSVALALALFADRSHDIA